MTTEIKLKILGLKSKEINTILKSAFNKAIDLPQDWEQIGRLITEQNDLLVFSLARGSPEWNKVHNKFKLSMPASEVQRIERIQNIKLWNGFEKEMYAVKWRYGDDEVDWRELFYGSKDTPPQDIYMSENGFKTFYNYGIHQVVSYFAKNSYYCSQNSYQVPSTTEKQMFLATVIDCDKLQEDPDRYVREAHAIPATGKSAESMNDDYADLYEINSNRKAYPSYLITYQ
ncbi:hypothetical protein FGO68_gene7432 [Halteria grandinella]|uniref:Uncharacterized protein n=1 Tax=Halteria grandinella TaxID=5974 RepID=A0A8J8NCY2_HALGN|nr:hypothetical protein FGO68_gene7432 [Halteria grandinella]